MSDLFASDDQESIGQSDERTLAPDEADSGANAQPTIDLYKLADKVYQLMRDELRLEKARGQVIVERRDR